MNSTAELEGYGLEVLFHLHRQASERYEDVLAKDYTPTMIDTYRRIRDEYAAEINRRGYEAE